MTPARWRDVQQVLGLALATAGAAYLYWPAAPIVLGVGLFVETLCDRGIPR
jgi:hypothetical protein